MPEVPQDGQKSLARYTVLAHVLDQAFRVPGTSWRFGLDPVLGLIPGAGDLVTAFMGAYGVIIARQLGAPVSVQGRMLLNLALDALAGAVPFVGDVFDFGFKAHVRNRVLLEKYLSRPAPVRRSSLLTLIAMLLALALIAFGTIWLAITGFTWLVREIRG